MAIVQPAHVSRIAERTYTKGIYRIGLGVDTPFWSTIPKFDDFYELTKELRNRFGLNPSGSATFAESQTDAGASPYGNFALDRVHDFITMRLMDETLMAYSNDMDRLITYVQEETDSALERSTRRINHNAFRNTGGAVLQLIAAGAGGATQTITVRDPENMINVFPGMRLVSSDTDGTSGAVDANPQVIASLNRSTGTITTSAASWDATIPGTFADGDRIFPVGDFGLKMSGLDTWVPASDPTTTLFGMDRSIDPIYLGGVRYEAQPGYPDGNIQRTLINAASLGRRHGARASHVFMHPEDYGIYVNEADNKTEYPVPAHVGFKDRTNTDPIYVDVGIVGLRLHLPTGPAAVIPDPDCQKNTFWMLDMRTWGYYGLKHKGPHFLMADGPNRFRPATHLGQPAWEANIGWYGQIGCAAPGCNIRVDARNVL